MEDDYVSVIGKSISFHSCWSLKNMIFVIPCRFLSFLWLNATATAYWKQLSSLFWIAVVFCFYPFRSIYLCSAVDETYDICKIIHQHSQIQKFFIPMQNWIRKFSNNFFCINTNYDFFDCICWLSSSSFDDMNLIFIVSWIFDSSYILWSFTILPKDGLISSRYCLIDSFSPRTRRIYQ